mmetsp:Transcript_53789/g.128903  ORF Transcript_53789/g.128903 Transcript_53789/m.128903 type:complete len:280 (+) Transcript_53789:45-884(+)
MREVFCTRILYEVHCSQGLQLEGGAEAHVHTVVFVDGRLGRRHVLVGDPATHAHAVVALLGGEIDHLAEDGQGHLDAVLAHVRREAGVEHRRRGHLLNDAGRHGLLHQLDGRGVGRQVGVAVLGPLGVVDVLGDEVHRVDVLGRLQLLVQRLDRRLVEEHALELGAKLSGPHRLLLGCGGARAAHGAGLAHAHLDEHDADVHVVHRRGRHQTGRSQLVGDIVQVEALDRGELLRHKRILVVDGHGDLRHRPGDAAQRRREEERVARRQQAQSGDGAQHL